MTDDKQAGPNSPQDSQPDYLSRFAERTAGSQKLYGEAREVTPGGISHFPRYHAPHPTYVAKARGSRIWDVDGNESIDLWMAHYDAILGHSPAPVVEALQAILGDGLHVGMPMEHEVRLAKQVLDLMPSAEQVRFCCSGSEADMYAVRLARAFTGRQRVLKMQGGFHGANTDLSVDVFPPDFGGAEGRGLLPQVEQFTRSTPFNDIEGTAKSIREAGDDLAAVILEPVLGAAGFLPAEQEYLDFLREETRKVGALLIFDEVITGFRVAPGGAQEHFGISPDLTTMGKVMGGGLPIGAIAGRADVLEISSVLRQAPRNEQIFIGGGTYSCNPLSMVAGSVTLDILKAGRDEIYPTLESRNRRFCAGVQQAFDAVDIPIHITHIASLMAVHFLKERGLSMRNVAEVAKHSVPGKQNELADRLRNHGVFMLHSAALSLAHSEEDIDTLIGAVQACAQEMAEAQGG